MHTVKTVFIPCILFLAGNVGLLKASSCYAPLDTMPRVFILGESEKEFESLQIEYEYSLMSVCENDYNASFMHWLMMLKQMEDYSNQISFDLKGVKMWLHVFWDNDGGIGHIGYYLMPMSKNVRNEEMKAFFKGFIPQYKSTRVSAKKYSHYATANFPTLPLLAQEK